MKIFLSHTVVDITFIDCYMQLFVVEPVGCTQVTCDTGGSPGNYSVTIADRSYVCDREGKVIDIDSKNRYVKRNGTLLCRAYDDVCSVSLV